MTPGTWPMCPVSEEEVGARGVALRTLSLVDFENIRTGLAVNIGIILRVTVHP